MQAETLKQQISAAKGEVDAELVLKRAKVVNVFTNEIEEADVAIHHGKIIGVGENIPARMKWIWTENTSVRV